MLIIVATCFLAYSNGSNDNFKGVATLLGSHTLSYKQAIGWATFTTFAGSISSIVLANTLVKNFSGKGLVPDIIAGSPVFLFAVAIGAGITVMLASLRGFPISTTHSLTGALLGSGIAAIGKGINIGVLGKSFVLPLILSPLLAIALASVCYSVFRWLRIRSGITKEWCICIGKTEHRLPIPQPVSAFSFTEACVPVVAGVDVTMDTNTHCRELYVGRYFGIGCQKAADIAHVLSGGIVSFARGLNDTPKIVALLLVVSALKIEFGMVAIAIAMAAGGLLSARKVALTMSTKITPMNSGQGITANVITAILVITASRFGMPVSTTHVSVGSLFGIGLITKQANGRVVSEILMAWVLTLPVAAIISGSIYWILCR